jgi:homocysteine S-methyltransferase
MTLMEGTTNPLTPWLARPGVVVLDGGLATTLETRGHDLSDSLWSARLLIDAPEEIAATHRAFLEAGADCITSASYQATLAGLMGRGLGRDEARETLQRSVTLARRERDRFAESAGGSQRPRPLVAASVGPWGAAQADGSEYTGVYAIDEAGLVEFHRERFALLAQAGPDLLACETLPSRAEARALLRLLDATPGVSAWFSFTARDESHIADGTPLAELARELDHERVVAVGVNCVPPERVTGLLAELRRGTSRPLVAYPNSGEGWDPVARSWVGETAPAAASRPAAWRRAGANLIGGCCRVGPEAVRELRRELLDPAPMRGPA